MTTTIQNRLAQVRANNHDRRIKHVTTMIAHGCYRVPYVSRMYRYDYERQEARRIGVWADVAQWILTGTCPPLADWGRGEARNAAYCRVRALMMLGMTLREAIRDAKQQTTPVVLYPYRGGGYCYEGQSAYTPDSFVGRVLQYMVPNGQYAPAQGRPDAWDMFVALRLMQGGAVERSVDDGCCVIVSLDSSRGMCEYGPVSVTHDRHQSAELACLGGPKAWDAFVSGGFSAGVSAR